MLNYEMIDYAEFLISIMEFYDAGRPTTLVGLFVVYAWMMFPMWIGIPIEFLLNLKGNEKPLWYQVYVSLARLTFYPIALFNFMLSKIKVKPLPFLPKILS